MGNLIPSNEKYAVIFHFFIRKRHFLEYEHLGVSYEMVVLVFSLAFRVLFFFNHFFKKHQINRFINVYYHAAIKNRKAIINNKRFNA